MFKDGVIDFSDATTFHKPVLELIKKNGIPSFKNNLEYEGYRSEIKEKLYSKLFDLLNDLTFKAYHFSRVLNVEKILQDGLIPLSLNFYEEHILPIVVEQFSKNEKKKILETHKEDYSFKSFKNRENQLSFTTDKSFSYADGGSRFWKTFGGEYTLTLINASQIEDGHSKISELGTPYVFELEIPISDVDFICKSQIIETFINYVFYPGYDYGFPEGFIKKTVIPKRVEILN
jgi:hypothetical protein